MHFAEVYFDFDPASKRWRVEWTIRVGRSRARHWRWVETSVELDVVALRRMTDLLCQDLESRLL